MPQQSRGAELMSALKGLKIVWFAFPMLAVCGLSMGVGAISIGSVIAPTILVLAASLLLLGLFATLRLGDVMLRLWIMLFTADLSFLVSLWGTWFIRTRPH